MKNSYKILMCLLLIAHSCSAQNNDIDSLFIEYNAHTRGNFLNIKLEKDILTFETPSVNKKLNLEKDEIEKIKAEISTINISKIHSLKAPSTKRFSDGTMIAFFTIKTSNNEFTSSEFDHQNPPKELLKLYHLLESYVNKKG
ncbi:hypothetical protein [Polaribacter aestuariivivens]|uniref:hypothetical protein n=1 Tax=Polaribacter aestuariivivens TaxID=2304626 RepID=UPI003F496737